MSKTFRPAYLPSREDLGFFGLLAVILSLIAWIASWPVVGAVMVLLFTYALAYAGPDTSVVLGWITLTVVIPTVILVASQPEYWWVPLLNLFSFFFAWHYGDAANQEERQYLKYS